MSPFVPKIITPIAAPEELFRQKRIARGWTIESIAKHLAIKKDYLIFLEEGQLDNLPAGLYGKNIIKRYAKLLTIDSQNVIEAWERTISANQEKDPFSRRRIARHQFIVFPKLIKNLAIILAISICFLYLIFYFRNIILPPELTIIYPSENLSIKETSLIISGKTDNGAEVTINGEPVLNNNQGYFEQNINLRKGLNNLIIRAKKKYSREQIINRQILVD